MAYGTSVGDTLGAIWRSSGEYRTASIIEDFYGERRDWDAQGRTCYSQFAPTYDETSKRIETLERFDAFGFYVTPLATPHGAGQDGV